MNLKLSEKTAKTVNGIQARTRMLGLQLQVQLLTELVDKLDPRHDYTFDMDKAEFIKTKKEKVE